MLPTEVATAAIVLMLLKDMVGQLLKEMFLDLGPTFIKVGQSLSTRPDIVGSEICEIDDFD